MLEGPFPLARAETSPSSCRFAKHPWWSSFLRSFRKTPLQREERPARLSPLEGESTDWNGTNLTNQRPDASHSTRLSVSVNEPLVVSQLSLKQSSYPTDLHQMLCSAERGRQRVQEGFVRCLASSFRRCFLVCECQRTQRTRGFAHFDTSRTPFTSVCWQVTFAPGVRSFSGSYFLMRESPVAYIALSHNRYAGCTALS